MLDLNLRSVTILSVRIIILTFNGEFLLLQRSGDHKFAPGQWEFPGGKLENQDDCFYASVVLPEALRELKEETGICLRPKDLSHWGATEEKATMFHQEDAKVYTHIFMHRLAKDQVKPNLRLSDEHSHWSWETVSSVAGKLVTPVTKVILQLIH